MESEIRANGAAPPASAASISDLSQFDAMGLAELIRTGQVTPRDVLDDTIRKIEAVNPTLNAVILKSYDRAQQCAAQPLGRGSFAGVPLLIKDNAAVAGLRLTRGSRALSDNVADWTAPFFTAAERAGFIVVGVTNMPEMGLIDGTENVLYGPTRNPWNPDYSPGGSSGGSAACVAAGVLPLAHGTDGGGSIRIPASHCGLFGLKASRGRLLPGQFGKPLWPRLVDGCLSRTVRDTAMYLNAMEDPKTRLRKLGFISGKSPQRLKIAVSYDGMLGQHPHPEVAEAITNTAQLCRELGHTVDEVNPPLDQTKLHRAAQIVMAIEIFRAVDAIAKAKGIRRLEDHFESRALGLREQAIRNGAFEEKIALALPTLQVAARVLDRFFQQWDVLLTPVVSAPVYKIGMRDQTKYSYEILDDVMWSYVAYTSVHNICGTTAMSVPLHVDRDGMPLGSQFAARIGGEAALLALAYELEEARPWKSRRPAIFV